MKIGGHVLSGKYRLCGKLGVGRSGTVYLAYHRELEEYRAVKIVPKSMADYDTFRREALFLKTLRHPGIPLVYDVEEDGENSYLIEEYLDGESLYTLVKRVGILPMNTVLDYGIQICRIIRFMNSAENPILYLDLQPKNLMVCEDRVKLTDFDHAHYASEVGVSGERYGTAGFAAPEQYRGEALDCRADVYAIGALLYFMSRGRPPGREPEFETAGANRGIDRIIRGCMAADRRERYLSAEELEAALEELKALETTTEQSAGSLTVVFAGARPGTGTTHAAFGISYFLTRNGYRTLYHEGCDSDAVRTLAKSMGLKADGSGVFGIGALRLRPYYGEAVKIPYLYYPVIIRDAGTDWRQGRSLSGADLCVLVCGGKRWETESVLRAARYFGPDDRVVLLFNHMSPGQKRGLPAELRRFPCLYLPFFADPFRADRAADACFEKIMEAGTGEKRIWKGKKRVRRPWPGKRGS